MKKLSCIIFSICLLIPYVFVPDVVQAQTLRDLKNELDAKLEEYQNNQEEQQLTQDQIDSINANINSIRANITNINNEIVELSKEIEDLEVDIEEKDKQIKEIMNFVQISNGESAYLEYAFGAQDFTDFIYRVAVSEQLSKYNSDLIDEYNQMIEDNKQKQIDLDAKKENLSAQQVSLNAELDKLGEQMNSLLDTSISIEEEIKLQRELIQIYEDRGCDLDEDIKTCGRELLPTTTAFYRPLETGYITSEYGDRCYSLNGKWTCSFHSGLDFSTSQKENTPVYAVGTGLVVGMTIRSSCGGNMVYVQHRLSNGQTYTSGYAHLRSINVSKGDVVTRDTVIGIMGGDPNREWWDKCSTGGHVHIIMANGLYLTDYSSWSTFMSKTFNPRIMINTPSGLYNWFYDRLSKY